VQSGTLDNGTVQSAKPSAPGGQINLASVASPGEVLFPTLQSAPNLNGQSFTAMGNIGLSEGAVVDVSANSAGTVKIRGGQLVIADATISADTQNANGASVAIDINISGDMSIAQTTSAPALSARTTGRGDAGEVRILSSNLTVTSATDVPTVAIDTHTSGEGRAGNVNITTGNLDVSSSSLVAPAIFIDSGSVGLHNAHGGDVTITATRFNDTAQGIATGGGINRIQAGDTDGSSGNLTITANEIQLTSAPITTGVGQAGVGVAGNITLEATTITTIGSVVDATGWQQGGAITIHANNLSITNSSNIGNVGLTGPSGAINITAQTMTLTNGSTIESDVGGDGNAGPINITATDHLTLSGNIQDELPGVGIIGRPTGIFSNSFGVFGSNGNAGTITITTPKLVMTDGSRINTSTLANGAGGDVIINAQSISISGVLPSIIPEPLFSPGTIHPGGIVTVTTGEACVGPCGNAGNISITTNQLTVTGGAQINSGTDSTGRGGTISINARDSIAITGTDNSGLGIASGVQSLSTGTTMDSGSGGNISLIAGQSVSISNGASVSASTNGPGNAGNILVKANDIALTGGGTMSAASTGAGNAGAVTIQGLNSPANSFVVDGVGSGVFTTTSATGSGGNITINADAVALQDGAHLSSSSTGTGNTGNIQINAGNQFAMTNSAVTTEANQSGGGIIKITTNPNGTVQLTDSTISASVLDGNGGGGSVNIDPQSVVLINSQILAQAIQGPGGNINITTNLLLPDSTSLISASSQFGQQGNIIIQSPISPASGKIIPLGQKPLLATTLLSQRCSALAGGNASSFTVAGRDSLPAEPGGWLSSPLALATAALVGSTTTEPETRTSLLSEATEAMPVVSLRRIAPPGFLTQNFAVDSTGCSS